jgi:hypothetical protein
MAPGVIRKFMDKMNSTKPLNSIKPYVKPPTQEAYTSRIPGAFGLPATGQKPSNQRKVGINQI